MKSEKAKTHLGERKMMNCGEEVEIVNYYNYTDIDVRFPDGYIKRHAQYTNFKRGGISRPTSERLMETRVMKDGNKATIIAYRNCNNIDVQFENGCVREHVRYEKFKIGEIYMKNTKKKAKTKITITLLLRMENAFRFISLHLFIRCIKALVRYGWAFFLISAKPNQLKCLLFLRRDVYILFRAEVNQ